MRENEHSDQEEQGIRVRRGRRAPFKQLPDEVIDDETISPEAKVTYWYLKRIADYDDDNAIVSMGKIAHKLGRAPTNRRAARSWVSELVTAGWVDTYQRKSDSGSDLAPEFIVHDVRAHPATGDRWTPGGGGLRVKGTGVRVDPGGGGSQLTHRGGQLCTGEGVAADPLSSRRVSLLEVSSSKNVEDPDGSSSEPPDGATDLDPHSGDQEMLGELFDLSRARGSRLPQPGSGSSAPEVAQNPAVGTRSSADDLEVREDVEELCHRLQARMIENGFKPPTITKRWRDDTRHLLDIDRRDLTKALNLIDWCQQHPFWKTNIKSPGKFRAQYDTLRLQAIEEHKRRNGQGRAGDNGFVKYRNPTDPEAYSGDPFKAAAAEQMAQASRLAGAAR